MICTWTTQSTHRILATLQLHFPAVEFYTRALYGYPSLQGFIIHLTKTALLQNDTVLDIKCLTSKICLAGSAKEDSKGILKKLSCFKLVQEVTLLNRAYFLYLSKSSRWTGSLVAFKSRIRSSIDLKSYWKQNILLRSPIVHILRVCKFELSPFFEVIECDKHFLSNSIMFPSHYAHSMPLRIPSNLHNFIFNPRFDLYPVPNVPLLGCLPVYNRSDHVIYGKGGQINFTPVGSIRYGSNKSTSLERSVTHLPKRSEHSSNERKRKELEPERRDDDNHKKLRQEQDLSRSATQMSKVASNAERKKDHKLTPKLIYNIPGDDYYQITERIVSYYNSHYQREDDLQRKILLSNSLSSIVKDVFPGCHLYIVGSTLSGFSTRTSDMDLCLLLTQRQNIDQRSEAVEILRSIRNALRCCSFIRSCEVIRAKVPILKFTDAFENIECDLNINNGIGIRNTHLLKNYCMVDPRVGPLMLFIKHWARFHDINDAFTFTISSYSLALMMINYLQGMFHQDYNITNLEEVRNIVACSPPVLPCLQKLYPERFDQSQDIRNLQLDEPIQDHFSQNSDSLGKLFQGFLEYYAFKFRPNADIVSVREGQVLSKRTVKKMCSEPEQWKFLCVEEPFALTNTARSVCNPVAFQRVMHVFTQSAQVLKQTGNVNSILFKPFEG